MYKIVKRNTTSVRDVFIFLPTDPDLLAKGESGRFVDCFSRHFQTTKFRRCKELGKARENPISASTVSGII